VAESENGQSTPNNAQSDIHDANAKLTALLDAAIDAIIIINHKGQIELFNAAAQRMFGYKSAEVVGQNVKMLMPEPYQHEHDQYLDNYIQTTQARIIGSGREVKALKKSGEIFPIDLSVGEVKDSSHKQFVGIIRDMTEQIKARVEVINSRERLAHVSRLNTMGEMAAGIAHEINQPLTAVTSYAQACKNILANSHITTTEQQFPKQRLLQTLDKISEQALRAAEVIKRLRAFVKKRKAQRELIDLNQLIAETIELASIDTRLLDHGITLKLTQQFPPLLLIDPIQIQQVLFNLIRNAIDAMEDQTNEPIEIYSQWIGRKYIEVGVIDSGLGIKEQDKTLLFTPFFSTKNAGMGMGLPISQSIIQAHGGELKHHSRASRGSIFSFTLPVSSELTGDEKANEQ